MTNVLSLLILPDVHATIKAWSKATHLSNVVVNALCNQICIPRILLGVERKILDDWP